MAHDPTLLVMRHAHAASRGRDQRDIDRPLTVRGRRAARERRETVAAHHPTRVLCSPAQRARQTVQALRLDGVTVQVEPAVYDGGPEALLHHLAALDQTDQTVLLVGHLPTVEQLVRGLVGVAAEQVGFAPAAVAVLGLDRPWAEVGPGCATVRAFHG